MTTDWTKITASVSRETVEAVSEILTSVGAGGVEIVDTADYLSYQTHYGEVLPENITQRDRVQVSAYFSEHEAVAALMERLRGRLAGLTAIFGADQGAYELTATRLAEADWATSWKQFFKPTRVTHGLTIVPEWTTDYVPAGKHEELIRLDPGMAFGTGTHPTTRLSLYALSQLIRGNETVIDVGTGSGVLAIAAVKLGAAHVTALDLDDVAVKVAQANIALNPDVAAAITVTANDLLTGIATGAELVVANILADILLQMIDDAYKLVKSDGYLIFSGVTTSKLDRVIDKAVKAGFKLETQMSQGDWQCLIFKKTDEDLIFG